MIPKKIFKSFPTTKLPKRLIKNLKVLQERNPDWDIKVFDDNTQEQFIKDNFDDDIIKAYFKINPLYGAARSDLFRYLLIFKEGGVWLDSKSSIAQPIDNIILPDDKYILSYWGKAKSHWGNYFEYGNKYTEFLQFIIIAEAGHPFLKAVIDQTINNINNYSIEKFGVGKKGTLNVTGPIMYTKCITDILEEYPHRFINAQDDYDVRYSILKNQKMHLEWFGEHYAKQSEPIIQEDHNET